MARLELECKDEQGHKVTFVSSDKKAKELFESYKSYQKYIKSKGFTQVGGSTYSKSTSSKKKKVIENKKCPKCGADMWDNRQKKQEGEYSQKSPDFVCKNKDDCGFAAWPNQYELK